MRNEKFRKAIQNFAEENEIDRIVILDDHAYDNSIVGITDQGIIIYDFNKMVEELMEDEGWEEEDAIEWIEYNTLRALPYMGDERPLIINNTVESITEFYAD